MKIAQVCPRYHPYIGGIETHVREISERFLKRGHEVAVLSCDSSQKLAKEEVINGVNVKRFKSWTPNEAYYFSDALKQYLLKNSESYDIVHAHCYHAFPALYAAQAKSSNKLVFTPHYLGKGQTFLRNLLHVPYKFVGKKIFQKSDRIICVSNYEAGLVKKKFKLADEKFSFIPNGVNMDELSKYKWTPNNMRPKITYSGRLERSQKNVDKLVQSFQKLAQENGVDAEFVIIGRGPYENGLKKLIEKLRLEKHVKLKRWLPRNQYLEEIASSDVFVQPSEHECYGIAAAEAIVMGVPTVVANSTALSEFVENRLALGIDTPITPERIAGTISEALAKPETTKASSSKGKILSWDEVATKLERLYIETRHS